MTTIAGLAVAHAASVAQLHMAVLRTPFRGRSGKDLLTVYYRSLVAKQGASCFVALEAESVAGFVCGIWDAAAVLRHLLCRHGTPLVWHGVRQALENPALVMSLAGRACRAVRPTGSSWRPQYELRPIAVRPASQGRGIAAKLVETLRADASSRGCATIHLLTEADNTVAQRFYLRNGFRRTDLASWPGEGFVGFCFELTGLTPQ